MLSARRSRTGTLPWSRTALKEFDVLGIYPYWEGVLFLHQRASAKGWMWAGLHLSA